MTDALCIHACAVNIFGYGILLKGKSGIGKSELALSLVDRGHSLISDDTALLVSTPQHLLIQSPEITHGMISIRGIGIVDLALTYGEHAIAKPTPLAAIIELTHSQSDLDSLSPTKTEQRIEQHTFPHIRIYTSPMRDMALLTELLVKILINGPQNNATILTIKQRQQLAHRNKSQLKSTK